MLIQMLILFSVSRASSQKSIQKPKSRSSKHKPPSSSPNDVAKCILDCKNAGLNDALEWIKENFEDAMEDLADEDDENGIPIVAILDCAVNAMDNPLFLKMIKSMGINEPADAQVNDLLINIKYFS